MPKRNRFGRLVELGWLALLVSMGACGQRVDSGAVGTAKDDGGPPMRGQPGDDGGASDVPPAIDAGAMDAVVPKDAVASDAITPRPDAGQPDLGPPDTGPRDTGPVDTGPRDSGPADTGPRDTGPPDLPPRECTAPAKRCMGLIPQACDADGTWQSDPACPFLCVAGACTGECIPGSNQCVGGDLQICDGGGAWQSTGTSAQELLVNPAFDLDANGSGWTNPGVQIIYAAATPGAANGQPDVAAQSLPNLAWFGGLASSDDRLSQSIDIPATAASLTFSFFYAVVTGKTGTTEADTFDVTLLAGTQVMSLAHLSNLNATDTWTPVSVTLPATLAGQTVTLQLRGITNANTRFTSFYVDTLSLQAVACP